MSTAEARKPGDMTIDHQPEPDDLNITSDEPAKKDAQGALTQSYVPKKEVVPLGEYVERLDRSLHGLPGLSEGMAHVSAASGKNGNMTTEHFFHDLWEYMERQQSLRDEVGIGICVVRWRLEQLMDPTFVPQNMLFSSGIRGREIAAGGMGAVHQVAIRGRLRAAKELIDPDEPELLSRFIKEQEALQLLDGEIGPQFDGVEVVSGKRHIVMEWIDGKTLDDLTEQFGGKVPPGKSYGVLASFAAAIANLNEKFGIFHRDIKPKNVMVNQRTGEVKIIDFGVMARKGAKQCNYSEQSTLHGARMGTPVFMCQEQFDDAAELHPKNETFAIGATAYYVLTGEYPCPGLPSERKAWDGTVDLAMLPEDKELRQWLGSLMDKDREKRPPLHEAGKFAFERSEHFEKFNGDWEAFLATNNARRSIDPALIRSESAVMNGNATMPRVQSKLQSATKIDQTWFWTTKKTVTGISMAAALAIAGMFYGFRGDNGGNINPEDGKDGNGSIKKNEGVKKNRERKSFPKNPTTPMSFAMNENGLWSTTLRIPAEDSTPEAPKWAGSIHVPADCGVYLLGEDKKSMIKLYELTKEDCLLMQGLKKGEEDKLFQPFKIGGGATICEYHFPSENERGYETYVRIGGVGEFIDDSQTIFVAHEEAMNFAIIKAFKEKINWNLRGGFEEFQDFWIERAIPKLNIRLPEKEKTKYLPRGPIHNLAETYKIYAQENIKRARKMREGVLLDRPLDPLDSEIRRIYAELQIKPYTREQMMAALSSKDPIGKYGRRS